MYTIYKLSKEGEIIEVTDNSIIHPSYKPLTEEDMDIIESLALKDFVSFKDKHYFVSTVFLSYAHGKEGGQPLLFETMVFEADSGNVVSSYGGIIQDRYTDYRSARFGHFHYIRKIKKGYLNDMENK